MRIKLFTISFFIIVPLMGHTEMKTDDLSPYGSSQYYVWEDLTNIKQLKVAFDFNFADPLGTKRALHPVSYILKTIHEYGPVSFNPINIIVVSHGAEVVVWAKKNYKLYKDIIDRAARFAEMGVKFEVCVVAATTLGFEPEDFHGFVRVVPLGSYALAYHQSRGYAVVPGAATTPSPIVNIFNSISLGKKFGMTSNSSSNSK